MRKDRERKKRKIRTIVMISSICLFLIIAAVLALTIGQNLGMFDNQKPFAPGQPGNTAQNTLASNSPAESTSSFGSSDLTGNQPQQGTTGEASADPVKTLLESLTLEEKVGQLVIVGLDGYSKDVHSSLLMEQYHVGGFILFKKNIQETNQLLNLLNSLKKTNSEKNKVPLFLSVDEEGGRVSRLPEAFKKFPSNKVIGRKNDSTLSYEIGSILGEELKAFGFNMDFAPVLDINSNPKNPVIGDRSFGKTPELVSRLGIETMKGLQAQKVISVVKHFPGHGDTSVDSHVGLPRVNHDLERLERFELQPFKAAVENAVDAIMIAHILLPKLDEKNPASFSKAVLTDLLRIKMKYNGVVITDDFTMGAITENFHMGQAAVKSIQAGGDIVLVCHGYEKQEAVIKALLEAARSGQISTERLNESVYRILMLKQKYSLTDTPAGPVDVKEINEKIQTILAKLK